MPKRLKKKKAKPMKTRKESTREVPSAACAFVDGGVSVEETGNQIEILANSGKPIRNHWYWGNFAVDLDGIEINRQDKPILLDHKADQIVGYTSAIENTENGLMATGKLLATTEQGKHVQQLAAEGFPWQASVYIPPSEVEKLGEGESVIVNGYLLNGPGHVFRKSTLREVTVTALGADEDTSAEVFAREVAGSKGEVVTKITEKSRSDENQNIESEVVEQATIAAFDAVEDPDRLKSAITADRNRIAKLHALSTPDQKELVSGLIDSDASLAEGLEVLLSDTLRKLNEKDSDLDRQVKLARIEAMTPESLGHVEVDANEAIEAVDEEALNDEAFFSYKIDQFNHSEVIQAEWPNAEAFAGYELGIRKGHINE